MIERVLMKQVGLVEEKDGVDTVFAKVVDVGGDGVEDAGSGDRRRQTEGDAELAIEMRRPRVTLWQ